MNNDFDILAGLFKKKMCGIGGGVARDIFLDWDKYKEHGENYVDELVATGASLNDGRVPLFIGTRGGKGNTIISFELDKPGAWRVS